MKAIKNNKEYTIDETLKSSYLAQGYDIIGDNGEIERSPQSTVRYSEYAALLSENEKLRAENEKLRAENKRLESAAKLKKGEA